MWFIGDVHGSFKRYNWTIHRMLRTGGVKGMDCSLQVGDMGLFYDYDIPHLPPTPQHRFFRGNHDNPALCKAHPNYLGDFGYNPKLGMYWLAGGLSIDWKRRVKNKNWWEDEQLDDRILQACVKGYALYKPRILVSHECPTEIKTAVLANIHKVDPHYLNPKAEFHSQTEQTLQSMLDVHRPEIHIFGHYHFRYDVQQGGTRFIGLGDHRAPIYDQIFEIPDLQW